MTKPDPDALYLAVETFITRVDGEEFLVRAGTRWKGEVVRRNSTFFVPDAEADEPAIARARANLQARVEYA